MITKLKKGITVIRNKKWYITNKDQVRFRVSRSQHDKVKETIRAGKRLGGEVIIIHPKAYRFMMDNQYIIGKEDKAVSLNSLRRRLFRMLEEKKSQKKPSIKSNTTKTNENAR